MSNRAPSRVTQFPRAGSLQDGAALSAQHFVPLAELLTDSFVSRHTRFETIDALIEAAELNARRHGARGISFGRDWDLFIRSVSRHTGWPALIREACAEWQIRRIGLIIDA
jgi:hypothetical protein